MVRVLHIFHNMANGGVENFVMNYYRFIDRGNIQFDFLTSVDEPGYFDDEILRLGGRLHHAYPKKKSLLRNFLDIKKIVRENDYQIVHRHTGSSFSNIDLIAAKCGSAKILISHAHSTSAGNKILHYFSKMFLKVDGEKFACSKAAGEWLFGEKYVEDIHIIPNAIDLEKYQYNKQVRAELRTKYDVKNKLVIGHVGGFNDAKNHEFIVEIFKELYQLNKNIQLWLIGDGIFRTKIEKKVQENNLEEAVCFWGNRNNVHEMMQAMDIFLLPSIFEGYPVTLIEAQCAGLPCFVSEYVIPSEINYSSNVKFINLDKSANEWANMIVAYDKDINREDGYICMKDAGLDIRDAAKDLEERYLQYAKQ